MPLPERHKFDAMPFA